MASQKKKKTNYHDIINIHEKFEKEKKNAGTVYNCLYGVKSVVST